MAFLLRSLYTSYSETHYQGDNVNKIKQIARNAKDHVMNHKFAYVASALALAATVLQQRNLKSMYAFLESRGIDPMEFYCPEAYEELNN